MLSLKDETRTSTTRRIVARGRAEHRLPSGDGKGDEWWHQWPDPALTVIQYQEEGQNSVDSPNVWPDAYKTGDAIHVGR